VSTHVHDHVHVGGGGHGAAGEVRPAGGAVVLDIGGDVGALIVQLDDELEGAELPILALDDPAWDPTTHTGVWRRSIGSGSVVVAVYPALVAGRYQVVAAGGRAAEVAIAGGEVTSVDLRSR
jgi:hypothetical protein